MDPEGRKRSLRSGPALEKLMGKSGQGRSRQLLHDGPIWPGICSAFRKMRELPSLAVQGVEDPRAAE
jgi:hypothetical protein